MWYKRCGLILSPRLIPTSGYGTLPEETAMLRSMLITSGLTACLLAANFAIAQTEFSADVVTSRGEPSTPTKIYFGKDKLRIDPSDRRGMGGSVIMNLSAHTSTVLLDDQHMYMDVPVQMANQRDPFHFFRTLDADNACSDWLAQPWEAPATRSVAILSTAATRSSTKERTLRARAALCGSIQNCAFR